MIKKNTARVAAVLIAAAGVVAVPAAAQAADLSVASVTPEVYVHCNTSSNRNGISATCYGWGSAAFELKCEGRKRDNWGRWKRYTYRENLDITVLGYGAGSRSCDRGDTLINWWRN